MATFQFIVYMLKYSKDGVSVLVIIDRRRAKKNGLFPVKAEIVHTRTQKYFTTGVDMSPEEWEKWNGSRRSSGKGRRIESCFQRLCKEVNDLCEHGSFSLDILAARLGKDSGMMLNSSLASLAGEFMKAGQVNSYYRCRSALNAAEKYGGKSIHLSSVTPEWLRGCERFWTDEGKSCTTIHIYMKTIKCALNTAKSAGIIKEAQFPFGKGRYMIPRANSRRMALSKEHIRRIMNYRGPGHLEENRDLWLFSYLCNGINFRDMLYLRHENVIDGEICFIRHKTAGSSGNPRMIRATVTEQMKQIMDRMCSPYEGDPKAFLFRYAEHTQDQFSISRTVRRIVGQCNKALKEIAAELEIPCFTTYSARHSFATTMLRGGADLPFISESLGHSSIAMTENYLAGVTREERRRYAGILTDLQ